MGKTGFQEQSVEDSLEDYNFRDEDEERRSKVTPSPEEDPLAHPTSAPKGKAPPTNSKKKKKMVKKELNPLFKDVRETGQWGSISKKEIIVVSLIVCAVIIGVIVFVVIFATKEKTAIITLPPAPRPTMAPSMQANPEDELATILNVTALNPLLADTYELLPNDTSFYKTVTDESPAVQRAMAWVLFDDHEPVDSKFLISRFALATLYFHNGGENWKNASSWLSKEDPCDWYGIQCDRFRDKVDYIDLGNNNLVGSLPDELNYLQSLQTLILNKNDLTGTIPGSILGQLPTLSVLSLDHNKLNGTIGEEIRANKVLTTLFLQYNDLTGLFPKNLCADSGEPQFFSALGLDCSDDATVGVFCLCCCESTWGLITPCFSNDPCE